MLARCSCHRLAPAIALPPARRSDSCTLKKQAGMCGRTPHSWLNRNSPDTTLSTRASTPLAQSLTLCRQD